MNDANCRPYAAAETVPEPPEVEVIIETPRGSFLKRGATGDIDFQFAPAASVQLRFRAEVLGTRRRFAGCGGAWTSAGAWHLHPSQGLVSVDADRPRHEGRQTNL